MLTVKVLRFDKFFSGALNSIQLSKKGKNIKYLQSVKFLALDGIKAEL
jgi:hypothetical protein